MIYTYLYLFIININIFIESQYIKMKRGRLVKLENFNSNETFKGVIKYKNDF